MLAVLFALNQTLLQHEGVRAGSLQGSYTTEDLITHYNCGDLSSIIFNHDTSQLPHFINSSLPAHERTTAQQIDSYFRQELIYKRNQRMASRVSALMQRSPTQTFFFAFGAGHFLGNHSVLDILRQEGYEVEHTPPGEPITDSCQSQLPQPQRASPPQTQRGMLCLLTQTPHTCPSCLAHQHCYPLAGVGQPPQTEDTTVRSSWGSSETVTQQPHSWGTSLPGPVESQEDLPHLLLPDSLSQLEEFGRQKRPRKHHRTHNRPRLFSDLWVRMEASTTPLPNIRITNGYITVQPPLTHQEQLRRPALRHREQLPSSSTLLLPLNSALPSTGHTFISLIACLISHMLLTS
ncbi:hypothetical protein MATL_G00030410 [Megalops atlanticus]|uniref:Metalloprotease TIKI n=1 Tax=Megalops atlanticus TaxID=7932 RepID=A0A9D3QH55_MEGAT|nr:hypothetical protein MATL_G00030410 [Megalops atlanticus]